MKGIMVLYKGEERLLNKDLVVRTSYSVGTIPAGTKVEIQQIDDERNKVLVDNVWFHKSIIENISSSVGD